MEKVHSRTSHKTKNYAHKMTIWIATVSLFGLSSFILAYPFFPQLTFYLRPPVKSNPPAYVFDPTVMVGPVPKSAKVSNYGIVSSAKVSGEIFEGVDSKVLDKGMWHIPTSSTPEKGGNTVITGHRFTYLKGAGVFYHLDKVQKDEIISIYWEGKKYAYKVYEITTVSPTALDVEKNTEESILTLYTCTPIMTATERLVVRAKLIQL